MRPSPIRRRRGQSGFTVVELLVSLALLGLAAVLIGQGFAVDRGALGRMQQRTTGVEEVAAAQDLIRDRIEHLFARTRYDALGASVDLDGAPDRLDLLAWPPPGSQAAGVQRYALSLRPDGVLSLDGPAAGGPAEEAAGALMRGVRRLDIAYYGATGAGGRAAWRPDWSRQPSPPELVRITLAFAAGDRRVWPELIVRPAATVDAGCMLDPETSLCRGRS